MKLKMPKVEEEDRVNGQLGSSLSLPVESSAHEADVYRDMEDYGTNLWRVKTVSPTHLAPFLCF
jgi:hypothetical protein